MDRAGKHAGLAQCSHCGFSLLTSDELLASGSEGLGADDHVNGFLGAGCGEQRGKEDRGLLHFLLVGRRIQSESASIASV